MRTAVLQTLARILSSVLVAAITELLRRKRR
jgi:hypothetical protein